MSAYEDVASGNGVVDSIGVVPAVADVVIAGSGKTYIKQASEGISHIKHRVAFCYASKI